MIIVNVWVIKKLGFVIQSSVVNLIIFSFIFIDKNKKFYLIRF